MKKCFSVVLFLVMLFSLVMAESVSLSLGSSGDEVRHLQQRLITLGLDPGAVDGDYGSKTKAAISEAQRLLTAAGFEVVQTGEADGETLRLLFDPDAEASIQTLRIGSKGDRVRELQVRLIDLKLLQGNADGDYGNQTAEAVRLFQQKMLDQGYMGVSLNGIADPKTISMVMGSESLSFPSPMTYDITAPFSLTSDMLYAKSCILIDAPSGDVLFEHDADEVLFPASTTKMMTLLIALENTDPEQQIVVPASAADVPADSSLVPVHPGEKMTMRDLLYGLMLRSGNDAANAVGELVSGSVDAFVEQMNVRAQELGMTKTHYENPHGYHDENHFTTARDLACLARFCMTNPAFCEIVTYLGYTIPETENREAVFLPNTYEIFDSSSPYYIEGAAGIKSGYTSDAGFCYAGAAQRGDRTLIAVILGVPGRNRGWTDLKRLFEYGFALE